jgi:hypothetical protein
MFYILQNWANGRLVDNQFFHRLVSEQVLVKDAFQRSLGNVTIFDRFRVDDHYRAVGAHAQTVRDGAGNVLGVVGVVQAILLDKFDQSFF